MKQQWNDTVRRTEGLGENLPQCHIFHNKSHMNCSVPECLNPGLCEHPKMESDYFVLLFLFA
jgi:hypothetical protein